MKTQLTLPEFANNSVECRMVNPAGYRGLYAFHKYWGKKPAEPIRYLINHLCPEGGLTVDPFLGSGVSAIEALRLKRRFVGVDINPVAVRIARLLSSPPLAAAVKNSFSQICAVAKEAILESYLTDRDKTVTHYFWHKDILKKVWVTDGTSRNRVELSPSIQDIALAERFAAYRPNNLRAPRFFTNSRINSYPSLTLKELFTGRALRNIELLLTAIDNLPSDAQDAMRLSLTAAVGQMSKMVFAITGRGKTSGIRADRMEVGSWVIGYWRPEQHFEVNVWNCFKRRVQNLVRALAESEAMRVNVKHGDIASVCDCMDDYALLCSDALQVLPEFPDKSVDLIITDPPHCDRIPYLELSEMWNVILGEEPPFENEIVVSNAKERGKNMLDYNKAMSRFVQIATRKLSEHGFLVLFFNARTKESWNFLESISRSATSTDFVYRGSFPLIYSAASIVQDNRKGGLRNDYGLVFAHSRAALHLLNNIPGWTYKLPSPTV